MIIFLYLATVTINFIFGSKVFINPLNKYKNKYDVIVIIFTFIVFYILMSGYRNNSGLTNDVLNNQLEYNIVNSYKVSTYEPLYVILMKIGRFFYLDFYTWRNVMILWALILLFYTTLKWVQNPHFLFAMFATNLLIQSSHIFRNFLALSVFFLGLCIYKYTEKKSKKFWFIFYTILASLIHSSYLVYFAILLIDSNIYQKNKKIIYFGVAIFCLIIFFNGTQMPGIDFIISKMGVDRLVIYFQNHTRFGFILFIILHMTSLFSIWLIRKNGFKTKSNKVSLDINYITIIFYPLFMIDGTFIRLVRNLLLEIYSTQGDYLIDSTVNRKKLEYLLYTIIFSIFWFLITYFIQSKPEILYYPFFTDNIYFK
ncbi:EpsG family protein [Streptococcus uberis]|uniref:EpsG family protein n=1 Tax=Streptococcus uberis TaxID=1349 RepID=UPI003D788877